MTTVPDNNSLAVLCAYLLVHLLQIAKFGTAISRHHQETMDEAFKTLAAISMLPFPGAWATDHVHMQMVYLLTAIWTGIE